ncbi:Putative disease resistance RPP13-like protein 1 [Triticum urartu]|uniref:Putative disease resistance RPP13-like protein 1 n=1 Tax=Triticum urartu TaxID=4572 RepID=M7ZEX3_TRIUA|nr:uncharacterized protein LOC125531813 [Triticum urartu]EMS61773.1 Putative disease resistance RPP13-like protein 1 [Triticum urartu]
MEAAISALAGELVSRFISFLINKYQSSLCHAQLEEEKVAETLQHLLMRVATVVEEADARYITNTRMMMQLKMLSEAMYGGHRMLDMLSYQAVQKSVGFDEVSSNDPSSNRFYLAKRSRSTTDKVTRIESRGALEILGIAVDNMAEFVVLLSGCEHMSRRPYDVYLYTDNFMFSRHTEKQKILRFLLQHNDPPCYPAPAVLPIIGGSAIGKKTLVAHACGDERVRSCFSSVLHLKGDGLLKILDHGSTMEGMRMLVVIEFAFDISDDDWKKFHSVFIGMDRRCKIIIISRLQSLARFGSVKPIFLSVLSYDELRYLFKTLAFGSVDPAQHPPLVQVADEFAKVLHGTPGALVATNTFADVLRRNLNVQYWRCVLEKRKIMVKRNLSMYGGHPSMLIGEGHPVDITDFALHPLSMTRYTINGSTKKELPCLTFGELIADPSARPKQDFVLVSWESRIPPHNSFAHFVTSHAEDTHEGRALSGRKRRGVSI